MLGKIDGTENNVIMHMAFVNVRGYDVLIFAAKNFIGKLTPDLMGFFPLALSQGEKIGRVILQIAPPKPVPADPFDGLL